MNDELNTMEFELQSKKTEDKMAILEDIFSNGSSDEKDTFDLTQNLPFQDTAVTDYNINNYEFSTQQAEPSLDDTQEIRNVELDELKNLKERIKDMEKTHELSESGQSKGKQMVKTAHPNVNFSNDIKEITTSFVNCFVLSFVTAAIGAGWLANLILHLR
ncbi:MAG: hypothetical protein IKG27_03635 [Bacilli bacterium]|nr:hypothetical protein [Bacilli bacterium]